MAEHKHAAVLRAIAEGKVVQYKHEGMTDWLEPVYAEDDNPMSKYWYEWRIKPEPKPDVVRWVNAYNDMGWETAPDALTRSLPSLAGVIRVTFDGETGKLKSAEVLP